MREDPNGAALLQAATTLLRQDLLAALPEHKRHGALMIANAMSIAMRQLDHGDAPERAELQALRDMLGSGDDAAQDGGTPLSGISMSGAAMRTMLLSLNRQLARRIRAGDADPDGALRAAALAHLRTAGRQRLLESSPKTLKSTP
ncbi:MAG TPA: DUF6285 domain-containing protein [Pseudoduganella sp.]|jgi:hypothetical protein